MEAPNPRRRQSSNTSTSAYSSKASQNFNAISLKTTVPNLSLRKGSTFHSPTSPRSIDHDPILSVPSLPRRSPTCSKQLEAAIAAGDGRIAQLIGAVERSLSGLETFSSDSQETITPEALPVPRFLIDASAQDGDSMDIDSTSPRPVPRTHRKHHSSDSGIGSTETSEHSAVGDEVHLKHGTSTACWHIYLTYNHGFRNEHPPPNIRR